MAQSEHSLGVAGLVRLQGATSRPSWLTRWRVDRSAGARILQLLIVLVSGAIGVSVVYATGGLPSAFAHLLWIPILLAAYYFGLAGAIGVGVLAGFALGPLSGLDAFPGPGQTAASWLTRMTFFVGVGASAALLMSSLKRSRDQWRRSVRELHQAYGKSLQTFASLVELRDEQTSLHCERVSLNARALGKAISMNKRELTELLWSGILHDLGKISTPARILFKPGALTDREYVEIKKHAAVGADILMGISPRFFNISEGIRSHHEHWDGAGYPRGLAGKGIPIAGRILAIVDVFEAITSHRPYRDPMKIDTALEEIREGAGTQFDPELVECFMQLYEQGAILVEGDPIPENQLDEHPLPVYAALAEEEEQK